jgi:hypothetical protein
LRSAFSCWIFLLNRHGSTSFCSFRDLEKTDLIERKLNIQLKGSGEITPGVPACDLAFLACSPNAHERAGEIERKVMALFGQYRAPLPRFAISFGVPVPDGEEIVQEVFLSFFRHLQLDRSRRNLRAS